MNYFAHYFFDHKSGNHYYNAGLAMPDFARIAEGQKRINTKLEFNETTQPEIYWLNEGSKRHYRADAIFHNCAFFKQNTARLDELFALHKFPRQNQRLWFVSHILFELLLDRVLISLHPKQLDYFYNSLRVCELDKVIEFLAYSGKDGKGRFSQFWERFISEKYLQYYVQDDSFLYSLNRTLQRARQPELTVLQSDIILTIVHQMEGELPGRVELLREELEK